MREWQVLLFILLVSYGIRFWVVMMWRMRTFLIPEESGITYSEDIKLAIGSYLYPKAIWWVQ